MEWVRWQLKWSGEKSEFLRSVAEKGPTPQALLDRPKVGLELQPFIDAFIALNGSRQIGFAGPQPIGMDALVAYYRMLPVAEFDEYLQIVQAMDGAFIAHFSEQSKKKASTNPPKQQARR